ncbi:MAG TPA: hypothetical protein VH413_15835 [Verrucomicrobiae bacterium]|jgi:hypothetical protein|nr:hypothetical protein [Verrucomicrobiae bacterium]
MKVIETIATVDDEFSEQGWTKNAATSPAFDFLKDEAEDIYTRSDGTPFRPHLALPPR